MVYVLAGRWSPQLGDGKILFDYCVQNTCFHSTKIVPVHQRQLPKTQNERVQQVAFLNITRQLSYKAAKSLSNW